MKRRLFSLILASGMAIACVISFSACKLFSTHTEHDFKLEVTPPTCTEQGYTTYECTVCGDRYTEDYVKALGHEFADGRCIRCNAIHPDFDGAIAGLYDENGGLLVSYQNSGMRVDMDYTRSTYNTNTSSPYYLLTQKYPKTTQIVLPKEVNKIGDWTFSYCTKLTSVKTSPTLTSIGDNAFIGCSNLKSIDISSGLTSIGSYAFSACEKLEDIELPQSLISISDNAFGACRSLTNIKIPDSVTSIGEYAFSSCSGLTSIKIPNSVTSIGNWAFRDCDRLTSVIFENVNDWKVSKSSSMTAALTILGSNLSDPATAADYLKSTYVSYYWIK